MTSQQQEFARAYQSEQESHLKSADVLTSFAGYIRKPKGTASGYTAMFYGENNRDSDMILPLGHSKYDNIQVCVHVYLLKDSLGVDMKGKQKNNEGETVKSERDGYPLICSFIATVMKPQPDKNGNYVAVFYAPNGKHADSINKLGNSCYNDALAYVDIRGTLSYDNPNLFDVENQEDMIKNHAWKLLESEKKEYNLKIKKFEKANLYLQDNDFLLNQKLFQVVEDDGFKYTDYLKKRKCCFKHGQEYCQEHAQYLVEFVNGNEMSSLPLCEKHANIVEEAIESQDFSEINVHYLEYQYLNALKKAWVYAYFIHKFSLTGHETPDSYQILEFCMIHGLKNDLPQSFIKAASKLNK